MRVGYWHALKDSGIQCDLMRAYKLKDSQRGMCFVRRREAGSMAPNKLRSLQLIRYRPDQLPEDQRDINKHRPIWIRGWRCLATPFRETRRRFLVLAGIRKGQGKSVTEHAPEDAVQRQMAQTENPNQSTANR